MELFRCPLVDKDIDIDECFKYAMAAEGLAPKYDMPKIQDYSVESEICLNCKHHQD